MRLGIGAKDGARTRDLLLGKEMLYQLSYFRSLRLLRRAAARRDALAAVAAGAEGQNRTDDTSIFSAVLYLLSYLGDKNIIITARRPVKFKARIRIASLCDTPT